MDEDLAEVYSINSVPSVTKPGDIDGTIPDWLRPIMANEKLKAVWVRLSLLTLIINVCLIFLFTLIVFYNMIVQLFMIPELLGPVYVLAPIFIIFFCFFHSLIGLGWLNAIIYLVLVIICSWIWEELGVLTGIIFGKYEYTALIPYHISKVPLEVPFSWYIFLYISFCISDIIVNTRLHARQRESLPKPIKLRIFEAILVSLFTGAVAVGWDVVSDPMGSTRCSIWIWENGNGYFFGVPLLNFIGWFWLSSLFTAIFLVIEHYIPLKPLFKLSLGHSLCPLVLYLVFILYYLVLSDPPELGFVSIFSMGVPLLIALFRLLTRILKPRPKLDEYDPILEASRNYDDFYRK